jgi:hypothetical protein
MRVKRGTLEAERESGRLYVRLTDEPTIEPTDRMGELITELRDRVRSLESQLDQERDANRENRHIIAALTARILELPTAAASPEPTSQEPSESSAGATEQLGRIGPLEKEVEGQHGGPEERSSVADEPAIPSYSESSRGRFAPVGRLPLWQWILGGALSLLAFPAAEFVGLYSVVPAVSFGASPPGWFGILAWFLPLLLAVPGIFGYWVGRRLRDLSFWRHIAPMGALLIAGGLIGDVGSYQVAKDALPGGFFVVRYSIEILLWTFSPAALYSFAALLGYSTQHQQSSESVSPAGDWSYRQQTIIGTAGTAFSATASVIGLIITIGQ